MLVIIITIMLFFVHYYVCMRLISIESSLMWRAGQAQVDAHSILLTFCAFIYVSFPFGISTAATIRVGNLVGANRPSEARLAGHSLLATPAAGHCMPTPACSPQFQHIWLSA